MATADWILEQQRAEAAMIDEYVGLDAVIFRMRTEEERYRITADSLAGRPNCNGAVALQRAEDIRQVLAIVCWAQANLDRLHLIAEPPRLKRKFGGGR